MQCLHRGIGLLGMTALLSCTSRGEHRAPVVSASNSRKMYERINSAGGNATYTEYDGFSHFVWTKAYARDDLWQWVLSQRLSPDTRAGANGSSAGASR